jgi:hypothetical protein
MQIMGFKARADAGQLVQLSPSASSGPEVGGAARQAETSPAAQQQMLQMINVMSDAGADKADQLPQLLQALKFLQLVKPGLALHMSCSNTIADVAEGCEH